jgi:hypothetical protein
MNRNSEFRTQNSEDLFIDHRLISFIEESEMKR